MTEINPHTVISDVADARLDGRREGFAIAAFSLGLISFLSLLGVEKAVLAIVLAAMAFSGSTSKAVRRRAIFATGLALLYIITIAVVLVLFQEELGQLIQSLHKLS
jgi:hypothetical protein